MSASGDVAALVADDLTGANDTAVQFARAGWDVRLLLSSEGSGRAESGGGEPGGAGSEAPAPVANTLYATTTDARAASAEQAEQLTAKAVGDAAARGAARFYLKVDSTLRGSVAAQISGALGGLRAHGEEAAVVLCPAYPSMGRSVAGGVLSVHGTPVAETALRDDPATPVRHSDLRELVPGAVQVSAAQVQSPPSPDPRAAGPEAPDAAPAHLQPGPLRAALEDAYASGGRILAVDAVTDADLSVLAEAVAQARVPLLPAGSAGLAVALARVWARTGAAEPAALPDRPSRGRHLLQVSSLNPVSLEQVERMRAHQGFDVVVGEPSLAALRSPEASRTWLQNFLERTGAAETVEAEDAAPAVTVLVTPQERLPAAEARRVASGLGGIAAALIRTGAYTRAGLIGGDGALAALHALGCRSLRVLDSLEEGLPLTVAEGGAAPGLPIFTKAGGFGGPDSLVHAVAAMHHLRRDPTTDPLTRSNS